MINYDYYAVARDIAKKLSTENLSGWSSRICDAIESGSTGTEIFMALKWNIDKLLDEDLKCSVELKKQIVELRTKLSEALKNKTRVSP